MDVDDPTQKPRLLWDLSTDEHYNDPGYPVSRQLANGSWVVRQDGEFIYLHGAGASPDGDRPFLDRLDLKTLKPSACFAAIRLAYERFLRVLRSRHVRPSSRGTRSPSDPPNAFLRTLGGKRRCARGRGGVLIHARALTHMPDPDARRARHQEAPREVQAQGRSRPFVHALHPARLSGRHARPDHSLRLSARLRRRRNGRAGHRLGADLHAVAPIPASAACGLRHHRQRRVPHRWRPQEGVRHLPRAARGRREGRGRQGRATSASPIPIASASPDTATAR